jgi:hypothetical protein
MGVVSFWAIITLGGSLIMVFSLGHEQRASTFGLIVIYVNKFSRDTIKEMLVSEGVIKHVVNT